MGCRSDKVTVAGESMQQIAERFWKNVERGDGCWVWKGTLGRKGYGRFFYTEDKTYKAVFAHRFVMQLMGMQIPEGMHVCHSCDNPPCVNPAHLWIGTNRDNILDAERKGRHFRPNKIHKTHCVHGHEYTEANTYKLLKRRFCRACGRIRARNRRSLASARIAA